MMHSVRRGTAEAGCTRLRPLFSCSPGCTSPQSQATPLTRDARNMNTSSKHTATITVSTEDLAYARRLIANIEHRAYKLAVDAWWAVDLLVTLQARGRCTDSLVYRA